MYKATKMDNVQIATLSALIADVKAHEDKTVVLLGEVLPLALNHVWGNESVKQINSLIQALSPVNRKAAVVFFNEFQAHKYGKLKDDGRKNGYGKRINKAHTIATKKAMEKFFSLNEDGVVDPDNGFFGGDYWLWAEGVKVESKEVDYLGNIKKALVAATEKGGISSGDVIKYAIEQQGLSLDDIIDILDPIAKAA